MCYGESCMCTYLFYDIETTGLNKCFDQVLQFACIRTDLNFKELEQYSTFVILRKDVLYSPKALITNRISINDSIANGVYEFDAIKTIHKLFNTRNTISLGYNTLKFDDEFLRFSFYRNLLPPYTHQYQDGCYRMDILPITVFYYLFRNDMLRWPESNLRLENISALNQLATGQAHDALVDVRATIELAKRLSQDTNMWSYTTAYFKKQDDVTRMNTLPLYISCDSGNYTWGLMVGTNFGRRVKYQSAVLYLGRSVHYRNQSLWLRLDLPNLRETTEETISDHAWVIRKKDGEPNFIIKPEERFLNNLDNDILAVIQENRRWLLENQKIFQRIVEYYCNYQYPIIEKLDIDASLYQAGFPDDHDVKLSQQFHRSDLPQKIRLIDNFHKPELKFLAGRILCRNYHTNDLPPELVNDFILRQESLFQNDTAIFDYKGNSYVSSFEILDEITELRRDGGLDEVQQELLNQLESYIHIRRNEN